MPSRGIIGIIVFVLSLGAIAQAEVSSQTMSLSIICHLKKEVRTIRIEKENSGRCNVIYTKSGRDQNIGTAVNESSCVDISQNVKKNLEAAAWKCREAKDSRVSNLIEM